MYKALVVAVAGVGAMVAATVLFGPIGILLGIALTALAYSTLPNSHSRIPGAGVHQRQRFSFPWRPFMSSRNPHVAAMVNSAPPGSTVVINNRGPVPPAPPVVVAEPPVILRPAVHSHVAPMPTHARHAAVAAAVHSAPAGSTVRVTDRGRAASAPAPAAHPRDPRAHVGHAPGTVLGAPKIGHRR